MNAFWNSFETLLGLGVEPKNLTFIQISLRGDHCLCCHTHNGAAWTQTLALAENSIRCRSCLSFLPQCFRVPLMVRQLFSSTLGGGVVLVLLHRLFAFLAFYSHGFGMLVKGRPDVIVRDGQCDLAMMWRNHVSTHDLDEDMRFSAHTDDLSDIRLARVERSGDISFIKK